MNDAALFNVQCPGCNAMLRTEVANVGKRVKCPKCSQRFILVPPEKPTVFPMLRFDEISQLLTHEPASSTNAPGIAMPKASGDGLSVQLIDKQWQQRPGIVVDQVKTYGWSLGSEYVYCYSYPTHLEIAQLKGEERYRIKVGSAKGDPIQRIFAQFATNKTAISESLVVLLIFRTLSASHLERWLHKRLSRATDAVGSEWFVTNPAELIDLFTEYLRTDPEPDKEADSSDSTSDPKPLKQTLRSRRIATKSYADESVPETWNQQGHRIQEAMNSGPFTPNEIAEKTGLSLKRVWNHVNYEVSKLRAEVNANGQVVVLKQPGRRTS